MNPDKTEQEKFDELRFYTLAHPDPSFIHQHGVDAFAAQHADEKTKPITLIFALVGLYLNIEKGYTGKEVQRVHTLLATSRKPWPKLDLPEYRGDVTVADVLHAPPGNVRDDWIRKWCASVWTAYRSSRQEVIDLLSERLA